MQIYSMTEMYQLQTECYGCNTMTMNTSGMCSGCGGDSHKTESARPDREKHTLSRAYDIIERGSL